MANPLENSIDEAPSITPSIQKTDKAVPVTDELTSTQYLSGLRLYVMTFGNSQAMFRRLFSSR